MGTKIALEPTLKNQHQKLYLKGNATRRCWLKQAYAPDSILYGISGTDESHFVMSENHFVNPALEAETPI